MSDIIHRCIQLKNKSGHDNTLIKIKKYGPDIQYDVTFVRLENQCTCGRKLRQLCAFVDGPSSLSNIIAAMENFRLKIGRKTAV